MIDAEHGNNLPVPGDDDLFQPGELLDDHNDHILDVDSDIDEDEVADILDDAGNYEEAQVQDVPKDVQQDLMMNDGENPMNGDVNDESWCS